MVVSCRAAQVATLPVIKTKLIPSLELSQLRQIYTFAVNICGVYIAEAGASVIRTRRLVYKRQPTFVHK